MRMGSPSRSTGWGLFLGGKMLVSFRYTDGRLKPPADYVVTIGEQRVREMLERGDPIEITDGHEHVGLEKEPPSEPEEKKAPKGDKKDGWPDGYSFKKRGAYVALKAPGGTPIKSSTPSGKFKGLDAAQEAAWLHKGGE